ncbi:MAG: GHMP kinase [Candidatus Taylorbacteria bacterium]|nr:GHMP kinase [Candidatus Taylorbacteria bacterium]
MIITRTPFRVSFAGGGSDQQEFYSKHQGAVLSVTINKYIYLAIHPNFNKEKILLKYKKTEDVDHPKDLENNIARSILSEYKVNGVEIEVIADIPAQTGLGSSSSFAVGLHHLVSAYQKKTISPEELAKRACRTEILHLKSPIGKQDQYAASFGGINFIQFMPSGKVTVEEVKIKPKTLEKLQNNLLLFYTGVTRSANNILEKQKENIIKSNEVVATLEHMVEMAHHMKTVLESDDLENFGKLLHDSWMLKQSIADNVSNVEINNYYELALKNGASGGKLLGAGGGGFLLFYCERSNQTKLRKALSKLREVPFSFTHEGSEIIFSSL